MSKQCQAMHENERCQRMAQRTVIAETDGKITLINMCDECYAVANVVGKLNIGVRQFSAPSPTAPEREGTP